MVVGDAERGVTQERKSHKGKEFWRGTLSGVCNVSESHLSLVARDWELLPFDFLVNRLTTGCRCFLNLQRLLHCDSCSMTHFALVLPRGVKTKWVSNSLPVPKFLERSSSFVRCIAFLD